MVLSDDRTFVQVPACSSVALLKIDILERRLHAVFCARYNAIVNRDIRSHHLQLTRRYNCEIAIANIRDPSSVDLPPMARN